MLSKEQIEHRLRQGISTDCFRLADLCCREPLETALALWEVAEAAKELDRPWTDALQHNAAWMRFRAALAALEPS